MQALRSALVFGALLLMSAGCGTSSTLVTVHSPTGSGAIKLEVENDTSVAINNLYLARSSSVKGIDQSQIDPGSSEEARVWGDDLLDRGALQVGGKVPVPVPSPGRWDARALDKNGRYQHIQGLKLGAGGTYLLKLGEDTWHTLRH